MTRFIAKRYALVTCLLTIVLIADCAEAQCRLLGSAQSE
jgi:hypothetical protein